MAYSKELVAQLTKQIVEDIDDEVRQLVSDVQEQEEKQERQGDYN